MQPNERPCPPSHLRHSLRVPLLNPAHGAPYDNVHLDQLLATRPEFLLGKWIEDAKRWGIED
jgi:alpha-N-acetylglucosaminidase (NAGLU)-like protein